MNLLNAELVRAYTVDSVEVDDEELDSFLFSLGCYPGEPITVISRRKSGCTVVIKDVRYSIDNALAAAVSLK